ncbi:MAG: CDP-glycerol glycerophosphotransferase family protein [Lachnospiraceae bacterium]|nr:CDP-glycerol glycerophosphotransferase family protein [Lachnospiraceae bacterium]
MDFKLVIHRLIFRDGKMELAVSAEGPWDPKVRDPKLAVTFQNGTQNRRLPLVVRYYQKEEDGTCYIMASHTYNLKFLFYKQPRNRHIDFSLELRYGHTVLTDASFTVGSEDERAMEILARSVASDGTEVENPRRRRPEHVEYDVTYSDNRVSLDAKPGQEVLFKEHKVKRVVDGIVMGIWRFVLFWIAVALIPVFLIDAILAAAGCQGKNPRIPNDGLIYLLKHVRAKMDSFSKVKIGILSTKLSCMRMLNKVASWMPVKQNQIAFLSNRRDDLSGNFEFVNEILKKHPDLDLRYVLDSRETKNMGLGTLLRMGWYLARAKVVLVDDFSELFFMLPRRKGTSLIQLWHACGAFKTFGCSRMGRPGGQSQQSPNHRNYDYATVSSQNIKKFYAEGFGISEEKVVATGIPRTDVFFDEEYKKQVQDAFYKEYPALKGKKILLFAPTFRGNGKLSGYYPVDKLDVNRLYEDLNGEYAIIVKHHPFVNNRSVIKKKYQDMIIDLSDNSELNDLLFVTDVLITDYSSVVFEASLLDIPMLLYAYDLEKYISSRGFYYEYEDMAPGKIVSSYPELVHAIEQEDWENDKLEEFKKRFFDDLDGKSSQRTADLILSCLEK